MLYTPADLHGECHGKGQDAGARGGSGGTGDLLLDVGCSLFLGLRLASGGSGGAGGDGEAVGTGDIVGFAPVCALDFRLHARQQAGGCVSKVDLFMMAV